MRRTFITALVLTLATIFPSCRRAVRQTEIPPTMKESIRNEKPDDGILRVVVVGDSLAYGTGDESRKGISGRLEEELRRRGLTAIDVQNLGFNGATTSGIARHLTQQRVRSAISTADAIVLSVGANDLFEVSGGEQELIRAPFAAAERILVRVERIVADLRLINPDARIFLLGGYNPVPKHSYAFLINRYLKIWDKTLASRFERDPLITVVPLSDIIDGPERLSRLDHFHPGGAAYRETAKRIASMLIEETTTGSGRTASGR